MKTYKDSLNELSLRFKRILKDLNLEEQEILAYKQPHKKHKPNPDWSVLDSGKPPAKVQIHSLPNIAPPKHFKKPTEVQKHFIKALSKELIKQQP